MWLKSLCKVGAAFTLCAAMILPTGCNSEHKDNTADITVGSGDTLAEMTIQIGEETGKIRFKLFPEVAPKGVENFVKLAQSGYYDGKTIHRVVKDFMIQGGSLRGTGTGGTTADRTEVPRETNDRMRAYYGALGYAEDSEGINSQFFIVNNKNPFDIAKTEENIASDLEEYNDRLTEEDKKTYTDYLSKLRAAPEDVRAKYLSNGGVFSIDGNYTIFGQAIDGFDVIDKISAVEVSAGNAIDDEQGIESKPVVSIVIKKIEIAVIPTISETEATTTTRKTISPTATTAAETIEQPATEATDAPAEVSEETPSQSE